MKEIKGNAYKGIVKQILFSLGINLIFTFFIIGEEFEYIYLVIAIISILIVFIAASLLHIFNGFKIDSECKYIIKNGMKYDRHHIKKIFIYDEKDKHEVVLIKGIEHITLVNGINDLEKKELLELFKDFFDKDFDEKFFIKKHKSRFFTVLLIFILLMLLYISGNFYAKRKIPEINMKATEISFVQHRENRNKYSYKWLNVWFPEDYSSEGDAVFPAEGKGEIVFKELGDPIVEKSENSLLFEKTMTLLGMESNLDFMEKIDQNNFGGLFQVIKLILNQGVKGLFKLETDKYIIFVREYNLKDHKRFNLNIFRKSDKAEITVGANCFANIEELKSVFINGLE